MFASTLSFFWPLSTPDRSAQKPPAPRPSPVFIGDAVQPWGQETMLLSILQNAQKED
ncbi:MAG: hypothetical protein R8G34_10330 [Paracoccaceae bacterium]|nr:hypothetical protein [Paracoccaceae bacterium]